MWCGRGGRHDGRGLPPAHAIPSHQAAGVGLPAEDPRASRAH